MPKISDDILNVYIAPSKIGGRDSFYARPGEVVYQSLEDIMEQANFSEEEKASFIALSSRIKKVGKELTAKGQAHSNGFFETYFSITGSFDSLNDTFKKGRNEVNIHARLERDWQDYAQAVKVNAEPKPKFNASLTNAKNFSTNTNWNDNKKLAVQQNQLIILNGENLKVAGTNAGLELSHVTTGNTVLINSFSTNLPKELQFIFPDIAAGEYSVILKTYYSGSIQSTKEKQALLSLQFSVT